RTEGKTAAVYSAHAAGLLMVLTGLFNLLVAPLVAHCL
ncbi:hypothetical protein K3001_26870, partial [Pseudomonas aeruginosa]|nr:hypothetical protein [Pseudomonas aeruginosa]